MRIGHRDQSSFHHRGPTSDAVGDLAVTYQQTAAQIEADPMRRHHGALLTEPAPVIGPEGYREPVGHVDEALHLHELPVDLAL